MRPRNYAPIVCALLLVICAVAASATTLYMATINGPGECPPTASLATGTGTFVLNNTQDSLSYNVSFTPLPSGQTAAHIHKRVFPSCTGSVRFPFSLGSPQIGKVALTADDLLALQEGRLYVNVHSNTFPGGEIRGDILLSSVPVKPSTWGVIKAFYR